MHSALLVHPNFDAQWPLAADHLHQLWSAQAPTHFQRLDDNDSRTASECLNGSGPVERLACLGPSVTTADLARMEGLRELGLPGADAAIKDACYEAGIALRVLENESFWGQSVAEFALALTLCGLRRLPQLHAAITHSTQPWHFQPPAGPGRGRPGHRGEQFSDDPRFSHGTLAGKRVRIVGLGNVGSRFASWAAVLGADVAAWDPFVGDNTFNLAGTRRENHLEALAPDAEIFCPMLPLRPATEGLVRGELIRALPEGCLVVLVTRAGIIDMPTLRERVLADELALAADVFDQEPLAPDDPLLGRCNVVHTPHIAGRTEHANLRWAEAFAALFEPVRPQTGGNRAQG